MGASSFCQRLIQLWLRSRLFLLDHLLRCVGVSGELVGLGRFDQLKAGDSVHTRILLILFYGLLPLVDRVELHRTIGKCAVSAALICQHVLPKDAPTYLVLLRERS